MIEMDKLYVKLLPVGWEEGSGNGHVVGWNDGCIVGWDDGSTVGFLEGFLENEILKCHNYFWNIKS